MYNEHIVLPNIGLELCGIYLSSLIYFLFKNIMQVWWHFCWELWYQFVFNDCYHNCIAF